MINVKLDKENVIDVLINKLVEFWKPANEDGTVFNKM